MSNGVPSPTVSTTELSAKLLEISGVDSPSSAFFDPVLYDGQRPGFSVKRYYPGGLLYRPAKEGTKDQEFAILHCALNMHEIDPSNGRVPVTIRISTVGWPDKDDPPGSGYPVFSRPEGSYPCNLEDYDLSYDLGAGLFYEAKERIDSFSKRLEETFTEHLAPAFPFRGAIIRVQRSFYRYIDSGAPHKLLLAPLRGGVRLLVWLTSGKGFQTIDEEVQTITSQEYPETKSKPRLKVIANDGDIEYQGIKLALNSVLCLYVLVLIYWIVCEDPKFSTLKEFITELRKFIDVNVTLLGFLAIPILGLFNSAIPRLALPMMRILLKGGPKFVWRKRRIRKLMGFYYFEQCK